MLCINNKEKEHDKNLVKIIKDYFAFTKTFLK